MLLRQFCVKRRRQPKRSTRSRILIMAAADEGGDGRIQKMEVDFSSTVDEKIPKCEQLTKVMLMLIKPAKRVLMD